jgi:hypothetical protein
MESPLTITYDQSGINLNFDHTQSLEINVYNMSGQKLPINIDENKKYISNSELVQGVYIINVRSKYSNTNTKFVIR